MSNKIIINETASIQYEVCFSETILNPNSTVIKQYVENRSLLIVVSQTIDSLYGNSIKNFFNSKENSFHYMVIKTGEKNKDYSNILEIIDFAYSIGLDRNGVLVGIGGGILLDMVGFAASIYRRKIDYVRIPTTLIGQIDAGIGIKTGINHNTSKNLIGSFYPPLACINDSGFLATLPKREIANGLAEILKMAILGNRKLFNMLEDEHQKLLNKEFDDENCQEVFRLSVQDMLDELKTNFLEDQLERYVDFGHTFSPFIETYSNYEIPHGFAVALDMAICTEVSFLKNKICYEDRNRIINLINRIGLEIYDEKIFNSQLMWESLDNIINHRGGKLNLPIPVGIGKAVFLYDINELSFELLAKALSNLKDLNGELAVLKETYA